MEILQTGNLRRIRYERTEDVEATKVFQGIYGVGKRGLFVAIRLPNKPPGQTTAFKWYASGCRSLDDVKARKGGIKLSAVQEIGVRFYEGS
jgi:DNA polymerase lambda